MVRRYPVLISKDEDSAWCMSFVDIPAHVAEDSLEACLAEAQSIFQEFMEADEDTLPDPTPLEAVLTSEDARESLAVMLVDIDVSFFADPTEKRTLSAKRSQWDAIDAAAKREGSTRAGFMVRSALEAVTRGA